MSNEALGEVVDQIIRTKQAGKRAGRLVDDLLMNKEVCEEWLTKWYKKLDDSPAYALSWGMGAFESAAELEIINEILRIIDSEKREDPLPARVADIMEWLKRDILLAARSPARSTSITSNLLEQERLKAKAKWLDKFDWKIDNLIKEQDELDAQGGA